MEEPAAVAQDAVRDDRDEVAGRQPRSIEPRSVISQQCSNIRTLRAYSVSFVGVGFSNASAAGS